MSRKIIGRLPIAQAAGATAIFFSFTSAHSSSPSSSTTLPPSSAPSSSSSPEQLMGSQGYYVRRGFLTVNEIEAVMASLLHPTVGNKTRSKEVSKGRLHYNMLGSAFIDSKEIKNLITEHVLPIAVAEMELNANQLILSEVQIVDSLSGSAIQIWHADNASRGITVVIPLVDLTDENGPTELLSGSHTLMKNIVGNIHIVKPLLSAGDGVVFDARLLHRGGSNLSNVSRPILVIRFDSKKSPPPGMTMIGATARYYLSKFIVLVLDFV